MKYFKVQLIMHREENKPMNYLPKTHLIFIVLFSFNAGRLDIN